MGGPKDDKDNALGKLRNKAEQRLRQIELDAQALVPEQLPDVVHELQVHQIELEMQNEKLLRSQTELEAAHERYADLFELAPVGYCVLDEAGRVLQVNLTGVRLLGVARSLLANKSLYDFIASDSRDILYQHLRRVLRESGSLSCELELRRGDGARFFAQLQSIAQTDSQGGFSHYLIVISDISERRQHQEKILHQANFDALTGLPNRVLFRDRLEQAVHVAHRERAPMAHYTAPWRKMNSSCITSRSWNSALASWRAPRPCCGGVTRRAACYCRKPSYRRPKRPT